MKTVELHTINLIKNKKYKQEDIANIYFYLIPLSIDVENINKAIIERWSVSGLVHIKEKAWKLVEKYKTNV